jgi:hypothetical protein
VALSQYLASRWNRVGERGPALAFADGIVRIANDSGDRSGRPAAKRKRVHPRNEADRGETWRHAFVNGLAGRLTDPNRFLAISLPEPRVEAAVELLPDVRQSVWQRLTRRF